MSWRQKLKNESWVQIILLVSIIGLFFSWYGTNSGRTFTNEMYDVIRTTSPRNDVVVVGIDDKSLQMIGAWPWDRSVFAQFEESIKKYTPRAVGYDVLFLEPRSGDELFNTALAETQIPTFLASKYADDKYLESFLVDSHPTVRSALVNVPTDIDGKVRSVPVGYKDLNTCRESLSISIYRLINPTVSSCDGGGLFFRYSKPKIYSFVDVLRDYHFDDMSFLNNAYILVGSNSLDLPDHFVSISGAKIPGVQIHASVLTSFLNGDIDHEINNSVSYLLIILAAILGGVSVFIIRRLWLLVSSFVLFVIVSGVASVLLFDKHLILPLPWILLSAFVSQMGMIAYRSIKERKQNDLIKNIFGKYVHDDVLTELLKKGNNFYLGGEKKVLSIMFSDLRGFTTLSEKLKPEELTHLLNDYFSTMSPIILQKKGTIDKYIGDAIMAFWNAPLPVESHEELAVEAALKMTETLREFNSTHNSDLAMGIGIHTGEAVVGNFGSNERINYTALGDTVNLASRMEGLTKKYRVGVLVSKEIVDAVLSKLDSRIIFRKIDKITVKGKKVPTEIYEPLPETDQNTNLKIAYENAWKEYASGNWDKALELFKGEQLKNDAPSLLMVGRISELRLKGTDFWNGIWEWDEK